MYEEKTPNQKMLVSEIAVTIVSIKSIFNHLHP
jgi:hypothetical protein